MMLKSNHPDRGHDEVFLINAPIDVDIQDVYKSEDWTTKRAGRVAYDHFGGEIRDQYPVFVKIEEARKKGLLALLESA